MLRSGRIGSQQSLSSVPSLSERVNDAQGTFQDDVHSAFTFNPIPSLHVGISKFKKMFCRLCLLESLSIEEGVSVTFCKTLLFVRSGMRESLCGAACVQLFACFHC